MGGGGESWIKYHEIYVTRGAIERLLSMISGQFLFVEGKHGCRPTRNRLALYDMNSDRWITFENIQ